MKIKQVLGITMAMTLSVSAPLAAAVPAYAAPADRAGVTTLAAKNGLVKKNGKFYYYKNGKKVKGTKKVGGKTYYFASNGEGFLSVGSKKGNQAVAKVLTNVKFSNSMSKKSKLKKAYNYILSHCSYDITEKPSLKGKAWIYSKASQMMANKGGKCYEYTAITGLVAKALGYKTQIKTGKHKLNAKAKKYTEHSWVVVNGKYILDSVRDDNNGKGGTQYFYRTYSQIKKSEGTQYKVSKTFKL